jgi:hypothetical protein
MKFIETEAFCQALFSGRFDFFAPLAWRLNLWRPCEGAVFIPVKRCTVKCLFLLFAAFFLSASVAFLRGNEGGI